MTEDDVTNADQASSLDSQVPTEPVSDVPPAVPERAVPTLPPMSIDASVAPRTPADLTFTRSLNRALDRLYTLRSGRRGAAAEAAALMDAVVTQARDVGADATVAGSASLLAGLQALASEQTHWMLTTPALRGLEPGLHKRHQSLIDEALAMVRALRDWARQTLETDDQRAARRKRRMVVAVVVTAVLALIATLTFITGGPTPPVEEANITEPGGIMGEYFKGKNFDKSVGRRADRRIDFKGRRAWFAKAGADNYSVRWKGYLKFPTAGPRQLCVRGDDGIRMFFNGETHVDDWGDHGARTKCNPVNVLAQTWYPIRVEYYESGKWAEARLLTGETPGDVEPVRSENLCCKQ